MGIPCHKCGERVDEADQFCPECGHPSGASAEDRQPKPPKPCAVEVSPAAIPPPLPQESPCSGSECPDFILEWNKGASGFLAGATSSLQFRVTPISDAASQAVDFKFHIRFPGSGRHATHPLSFLRLSSSREAAVNYSPDDSNAGLNQVLDLCFSYRVGDDDRDFGQQLLVDVYPSTDSKEKILENLTIKIDSITQEGKAGDPSLVLLDGLRRGGGSTVEMLEKLKQAPLWVPLKLFHAMPPDAETAIWRAARVVGPSRGMRVSGKRCPAPRLSVELDGGRVLHLLGPGRAAIGRAKHNAIVARNLPPPGEAPWPPEKMHAMNRRISAEHAILQVDENSAALKDLGSTNGTFVNGRRIGTEPMDLPRGQACAVSLSNHPEEGLAFRIVVLEPFPLPSEAKSPRRVGGVAVRRCDDILEDYVVIAGIVALDAVVPGAIGGWRLCSADGAFALTDGRQWFWLAPGGGGFGAAPVSRVLKESVQYLG